MKKIILIGLFIGLSFQGFTQKPNNQSTSTIDTISFQVSGVCGMCKTRIENAALIKGVKEAKWDKETKKLSLIIKKEKINIEAIHESIAKAGHDTPLKKGDDKAYAKLPPCCKYRDKNVMTH